MCIIPVYSSGAIAAFLAASHGLMVPFCQLIKGGFEMSEEEQAFVVRDKRGRTSEAEPTPAPIPEPAADTEVNFGSSAPPSESEDAGPPITFSSFVFSLGTSALMLMGESLEPEQPSMPVNLPQAKEIVDILSMLEEKSKGNLSADEASVIGDMLYTLRMKYVERTSSPA